VSSRFFGWQEGNNLQREKDKTSGTGLFILNSCPVCGFSRRKGSHTTCSRIMQQRHLAGKL